jgi:hypothetical protein
MSWGLFAISKAPAVAAEIKRQSENQKCMDPEESVRKAAVRLIDIAVSAQDPSLVVKVSASGSQSTDYTTKAVRNNLNITIEPQNGFVE